MRKNAQPTISMVTPRLNKAVWAADLAAGFNGGADFSDIFGDVSRHLWRRGRGRQRGA